MAESSSHQALYYATVAPEVLERILGHLRTTGVVSVIYAESWGIDTSREVATEAYRTDAAGRLRHVVLRASSMTTEAQNALLKILEEPPRGVLFHCLFPPGMALLPTVRSRLLTVALPAEEVDTTIYDALVRLPIAEQLTEVEQHTKEKDTVWIEAVKRGALSHLKGGVATLAASAAARLYSSLLRINTRGASNKMLLEDVLLTVAANRKNR
jgi:hypothetical protein